MAFTLQEFLKEWTTLRPSTFSPAGFGRASGAEGDARSLAQRDTDRPRPDAASATAREMQEFIEAILQGEGIEEGEATYFLDEQVVIGRAPLITERIYALPVARARATAFQIPFDLVRRTERTLVANPAATIPSLKVNRPRSTEERLAMLGVNTLKGFGTVLNRPGPLTRLAMARGRRGI